MDTSLPRNPSNKVYRFVQFATESTISQTAAIPTFNNSYWILNSLDQASTFTALFDQYRIAWVEVEYRPMGGYSGLGSLGGALVPLIYTAVDYDDNTSWSSIAQAREYQNAVVHQNEVFTIKFKPHVAMAAYSGAFTSFANVESPWIDAASPTVQHYGVKTAITAGSAGQTFLQIWNITSRLTVEFRNVR